MGSHTTGTIMKTTLVPLMVCLLVLASLVLSDDDKPQPQSQPQPQAHIRKNFRPIISRLSPDTQDKVLIARADSEPGVEPSQTLAKVIQHNNKDSPYARTVVIQNTPQAFRAFGVKNIPQHIIQSWARYKRRTEREEESLEDQIIQQVFD